MSGADPTDVTEKKRLQNRMAQQKYRKSFKIRYPALRICLFLHSFKYSGQRLKDRIREFEELKKHLGDLPEMKDYVETGYSPPSTNIQNRGYDTKSTNLCLLPGQEVGPPESDPCPWAMNCPPISPVQSNTYPKIEPSSALDLLSPTGESLDYSSSSLSNESQKPVGSCARLAHQWSWALSASSPRVSNSLDPHQATQDNQLAVSPDDQLFRGTSCEERFIDILNSIHQAGYESIEKSKFAALSSLEGLPKWLSL